MLQGVDGIPDVPRRWTVSRMASLYRRARQGTVTRVSRGLDRVLRSILRAALKRTRQRAKTRNEGPSVRCGAVLAAYDVDRTFAAVRALRSVLGSDCRLIVVANSCVALNALEGMSDIELIAGSNESHEFSAYDEGLDRLRSVEGPVQVVVFANDRLGAYRDGFAELLNLHLLEFCVTHQLALGNLDDPGRTFVTPFGVLERYLRGNLFIVPMGSLPYDFHITSVDARLYDSAIPREYSSSTDAASMQAILSDPDYASFLWTWLTTGWYRGGELSPANWQTLREKARDILNEHWLTVRLADHGIRPVYAEQAAAVAMMASGPLQNMRLEAIADTVHAVGRLPHGDASPSRTARSLALAFEALAHSVAPVISHSAK